MSANQKQQSTVAKAHFRANLPRCLRTPVGDVVDSSSLETFIGFSSRSGSSRRPSTMKHEDLSTVKVSQVFDEVRGSLDQQARAFNKEMLSIYQQHVLNMHSLFDNCSRDSMLPYLEAEGKIGTLVLRRPTIAEEAMVASLQNLSRTSEHIRELCLSIDLWLWKHRERQVQHKLEAFNIIEKLQCRALQDLRADANQMRKRNVFIDYVEQALQSLEHSDLRRAQS